MSCGNTYNVRSFGATGDGSTPDQTAIQDAIDAAAAAGGGVVCFPAGTYRITATLVPKPHVSIHGEARANSIVKVDGPIWGFRSSEAAHVDYECEFADLTVRGNGDPTGSNGSGNNLGGINLERCDYVTFRNVRIDLFSAVNAFGLALGECFWSVLDRCFFYFNQNVDCELYVQTNGCNQTVIRD